MDEFRSLDRVGSETDQRTIPDSPSGRVKPAPRWGLLVLAPLLTCLGCMFLSFAFFAPSDLWNSEGSIPVTGLLSTPAHPTVTPGEPPAPSEVIDPVPGNEYREELDYRLSSCYASFHQFYLYEEMAVHEPAIFNSALWQDEVTGVIEAFRQDCGELGTLPSAPNVYSEVDQWLKLAAEEVSLASESFTSAVDQQAPGFSRNEDMRRTLQHVENFIEYAHNAETALDHVDNRREI